MYEVYFWYLKLEEGSYINILLMFVILLGTRAKRLWKKALRKDTGCQALLQEKLLEEIFILEVNEIFNLKLILVLLKEFKKCWLSGLALLLHGNYKPHRKWWFGKLQSQVKIRDRSKCDLISYRWEGEDGAIILNTPVFSRGLRILMKTSDRYIGFTKLEIYEETFTG